MHNGEHNGETTPIGYLIVKGCKEMRKPSWNLNKAMEQFGFCPKELDKGAIYEKGNTYWCNYWSQWYKVLNVHYIRHGGWKELVTVEVQWQDGRHDTHCTDLDPQRDWELIWP